MDKKLKNLLVFGYGLCVILAFIGWRVYSHHGFIFVHGILFAGIVFFLVITKFRLDILEKIYYRWMKVAGVIGHIFTTIVLSVFFYVIFGVVGILLRLLRKDFLERGLDRAAKTYWITRDDKPEDLSQYTKQF